MMKKIGLWIMTLLLGLFLSGLSQASDSKGYEHLFTFMPNYANNPNLSLYITSEEDAQGTVQMVGLNFIQSFSVQANQVVKIDLPTAASNLPNNSKSRLGVKVVANREVTVYGLSRMQFSTDAFLSLPTDALGLKYLVMSYTSNYNTYPSEFAVAGVYDNTQITITPSAAANGRPAGQAFSITLNSNDTFLLQASGTGDLTGSSIESSAPVAVSSGVKCANVPKTANACDHIIEMMPPVSTWGKSFLTVPLATRKRGDVFRILAAKNSTVVKINGATVATLNSGGFYETVLTSRSQIEASEPVLVAQYSPGQTFDGVVSDPFMMLVPPSEQFLSRYSFSTLGADVGFANSFVNVVSPNSDISGIQLDGVALNPALFQAIGQSGFSGAQIQVSPGSHAISGGVPFGIYVYGFGTYDSYGYPGGMAFDLINPQGDHYLPNATLMSMGDTLNVVATDSEDVNANGILDTGEDLNGNGALDRRTEDLNGNQLLDAGEDGNSDGVLDRDTGIFKIELGSGAKNLRLVLDGFVPGTLQANFKVVLINPAEIGSGILVVTDGAGNKAAKPILLSVKPLLTNVRVLSTLSTQNIDIDSSSFTIPPVSIEAQASKTVFEWRFDYITVDQIENLDYEVVLHNPLPNEQRLVTQTLELFYTDVNGNEVHTELGEQRVNVLPSILTIKALTDRQSYVAYETVTINAEVRNLNDNLATAPIRFTITDSNGDLVADLGVQNALDLVPSELRSISAPLFNTGTLLQGDYTVHAQILNENGASVIESEAPFAIVQDPQTPALSTTLRPDKLIYAGWDQVQLDGLISNTAANALLPPTVVAVSVTAPDGTVVYAGTADIAELTAGGSLPASFAFALADADSGTYHMAVSVSRAEDNVILDSFSKTFSVVRTALQGLTGNVTANPNPVIIGTPVTCAEDLGNQSADGVSGLAVSGLLVNLDTDNGAIISQADRTVDLAGGQTDHLDRTVDTTALLPGHYACVLRATVDGTDKELAAAPFTAVPPQITLSGRVFHDLDHDRMQAADEPGTDAGGLWVSALQGGLVAASAPVQTDGAYQLTVPGVVAYTLVLSTAANATEAALPEGWSYKGEIIGGVADAVADGLLDVATQITALTGLDFAIDGAPSVATDDRATTAHALAVTLTPLANDLAGPGTTGFLAATLDLDPATTTIDTSLSLAGQGVFTLQTDGSVLFTPDPAFSGLAQISYRVQDSLHQATNTATLTVAVGSAAVADSATTKAGESVSGSLSGNDIASSRALYTLQSPASHGTATVNATGGYTYSPTSGYQGSDSFSYQVCLPAPDATLCATALVSVTITATIDLRGKLELGEHGRLLVLVDPLGKECTHEDDDDHHDHEDDNDDDEEDRSSDDHGYDDHEEEDGHDDHEGDAVCQAQLSERAYLGRVLETAGWQYTIVDTDDAYTQALRGGAYRLHALLSAQVKLDEAVQKELREAVNHGLGLLVGGDHDQRNNVLDTVLGLHYVGHSTAYSLTVPPSPGYSAFGKPFAAACPVNRIRPLGSLVLGQFLDAKNKAADSAVTVQAYGLGKAAYLGFDPLAQGAVLEATGTGEFSQLLLDLLADVSPAPAYRAGDVIALNLSLHNAGSQFATGWLALALAGDASVYDLGGGAAQADGSLRWPFTLAADASLGHQVWARLSTTGTSVATLDIHADGSAKDPDQSLSLALPVTDAPALDFAKAQLLALSQTNKAYLPAYQSVQRAATAIAQGKPDTARAELLKSADALLNIVGNTAATVRQAIDEALRRLGTALG